MRCAAGLVVENEFSARCYYHDPPRVHRASPPLPGVHRPQLAPPRGRAGTGAGRAGGGTRGARDRAGKLLHGTGKTLEVRDVGPVLFRLTAGAVPIKVNGYHVVEDDEARAALRDLLASGLYHGGRVE